MKQSIRDELFDRIYGSLKYAGVDGNGERFFCASWEWNKQKEEYFLSCRSINNLVSDILDEHPKCWEYRRATIALSIAETGIVHPISRTYRGKKPWYVDWDSYWNARSIMMDLTSEDTKTAKDLFTKLGPNPTQGLSSDVAESKILSSVLSNKLWRVKKDFIAKVTAEEIRQRMIDDLLKDPLKAMQCNTYVYGALKEYSIHKY